MGFGLHSLVDAAKSAGGAINPASLLKSLGVDLSDDDPNAPPKPVVPGNIDLANRPVVKNPDGTISTVRSVSFGLDDGKEVLVPTITPDGQNMSPEQAFLQYQATGQHLGIYKNPQDSDRAAQALHEAQAAQYDRPQQTPQGPLGSLLSGDPAGYRR